MFRRQYLKRDNLYLIVLVIGAVALIAITFSLVRGSNYGSLSLAADSPSYVVVELSESEFLAQNPELSAANRFAAAAAARAEANLLYESPELKALQYQGLVQPAALDREFLAVNPEVKVHQRFVESIRE